MSSTSAATRLACPVTSMLSKTSSIASVNNFLSKNPTTFTSPLPVREFEEIPSPRRLPLVGTTLDLVAAGGAPFLHTYCDRRHKSLGRLYREQIGNLDCVFVSDADLMQQVYSNEGQYPVHSVPEPWTIFNDMKGIRRGLFFMDGPEWSTRRKSLNRIFLKKETVSGYEDEFNDVISDLLSRWTSLVNQGNTTPTSSSLGHCESQFKITPSPSSNILQDLERELYNWSIESLGTIIFGRRLGCVTQDDRYMGEKVETIHEFVQCIRQLFIESAHMTVIPAKLAYRLNLPVWKRFVEAAEKALSLARSYVEDNVKQMFHSTSMPSKCPFQSSSLSRQKSSSGVLELLTIKEQIDKDEVVNIITDLFLAAADTTSHATQWALYLLARSPESQEKIYQEVMSALGKDPQVIPREEHLSRMPYVKGVIKESLRLYPVAPFLSRVLDREVVLNGFRVPAGKMIVMSLYTAGRDPEYFPDPDSFCPERWIRNCKSKLQSVLQPHAFIPFGVGVRSCIGRRVAELQMQLLLSRIVQKFRLSTATDREVGIKLRMITTPEEPIQLQLHARN